MASAGHVPGDIAQTPEEDGGQRDRRGRQVDGNVKPGKMVSNVLFNYLNLAFVTGAGFLYTAYLVRHFGHERYGIFALIATLLGYAGLLDFGIGVAIMKMIAGNLTDSERVNRLATNGLLLFAALGVIFLIISAGIEPFMASVFHVNPHYASVLREGFAVAALGLTITFPSALYTGVLSAFGDYRFLSLAGIVMTALTIGGCVLVISEGGGVVPVIVVGAISNIVFYAGKALYAYRRYGVRPRLRLRSLGLLRDIYHISGWIFLVNLSVQLIFETDNVVVGSVLGVAAVASYQVALGPSSVIQALAQSANGVTLTTASALHGKAAAADQQRVFCETTRGAAIMALPVLVVFGSWGPQLLRAWVGGAYVTSSATLTVLAGGFTVISIQGSAAAILVAKDRYRLAGILAIAEAVANITLSVILAHVWGIVGVAAGTAIPTMLTTFLFYLPAAARVLELRLRVLAARLLGPLLINGAVAMVLDISGLRRERFPNLWLIVLADGVVFGVCVALAILLDSRERSAYLGLLRSWLPS